MQSTSSPQWQHACVQWEQCAWNEEELVGLLVAFGQLNEMKRDNLELHFLFANNLWHIRSTFLTREQSWKWINALKVAEVLTQHTNLDWERDGQVKDTPAEAWKLMLSNFTLMAEVRAGAGGKLCCSCPIHSPRSRFAASDPAAAPCVDWLG